MHRLFADAIEELLGQAAANPSGPGQPSAHADAWMLVTDIVTEPYRDNAFGAALQLPFVIQSPTGHTAPKRFMIWLSSRTQC